MIRSVALRGRRAIMLGVLVAGLFVGLVGMHHLSVMTPDSAAISAAAMAGSDMEPGPAHSGEDHGSASLHLCLAVLTAVAVLLVSAVLWRRPGPARVAPRAGTSGVRPAPRAPPATAPARLALLCVLRT
ncbi:DUF6153 family protein [Pseudonocardia abyssalis]|uniref:DUF2946 domain-containing protein n=1 Tax=Pseudonocardia abyssalis TaxID=2792008 RepID=A0ABS6USJ4_9PSEU|nr:DUF6153 family protein [Pseudonocardia abyssalis]MBW0113837.1 hypothetical protein [Pseudonocardia abyssalis]MBW0134921.1 hypothetical protein [Pseudonocardia abyssalis]